MIDTIRLYLDAFLAIATMGALAVIAGLAAAAATGDRMMVAIAAVSTFVIAGAVLVVRLWRVTRKRTVPMDPGV
jgi:hypothetical protein